MSTEIIIALISAIIPVAGNILLELIRKQKNSPKISKSEILLPPGAIYNHPKNRKRNWIITILLAIIFAIVGFILSSGGKRSDGPSTPVATSTSNPIFPSSIPPKKILEINFSAGDEIICITDQPADIKSIIGGYDNVQDNYFVTGQGNGYLTYCNIPEYVKEGIIEIKAEPIGSPSYFGYGVMMGFVGRPNRDLCGFEITKKYGETFVAFTEYIEGNFDKTSTKLDNFDLDTNAHTLKMVLNSDGNAIGYVDNLEIAKHKFVGCNSGRIGFIAYGSYDTKIIFDDLKLFSIP